MSPFETGQQIEGRTGAMFQIREERDDDGKLLKLARRVSLTGGELFDLVLDKMEFAEAFRIGLAVPNRDANQGTLLYTDETRARQIFNDTVNRCDEDVPWQTIYEELSNIAQSLRPKK